MSSVVTDSDTQPAATGDIERTLREVIRGLREQIAELEQRPPVHPEATLIAYCRRDGDGFIASAWTTDAAAPFEDQVDRMKGAIVGSLSLLPGSLPVDMEGPDLGPAVSVDGREVGRFEGWPAAEIPGLYTDDRSPEEAGLDTGVDG